LNRSLRFQVVAFAALRVVLNTMIRMVYPFLPAFSRGLGVDMTAISLALTLRSGAGVFGPFLAPIADSHGRKAGMLFGLGMFTLGVGLMAVWPSYPMFVLTLVITLVGNFVFLPAMQAYVGDQVAYERRGLVLALTEVGWSLAFIIGVPTVGLLIARFGWQSPFPIFAGLGLAAFAGLAWMLPKEEKPPAQKNRMRANFHRVLAHPAARAGFALGFAMSAANEMINVVLGVWMEDAFAVRIATLGAASAIIGVAELSAEGLVGGLTDRLGKRLAVGAGLLLNCLAALALPVLGGRFSGALVGLFFFYLAFEFTIVSSLPLMTEVMPALRATVMAVWIASLSLGRALGDLLAPPLYRQQIIPGLPSILLVSLASSGLYLLAFLCLRGVKEAVSEERSPTL